MRTALLIFMTGLAVSSGLDLDRNLSMREKSELLQNDNLWTLTRDPPPVPAWPDQFNSQIYIYVEEYGSQWNSTGIIYYDWKVKVDCNITPLIHLFMIANFC